MKLFFFFYCDVIESNRGRIFRIICLGIDFDFDFDSDSFVFVFMNPLDERKEDRKTEFFLEKKYLFLFLGVFFYLFPCKSLIIINVNNIFVVESIFEKTDLT